jgi:hypothetical protein
LKELWDRKQLSMCTSGELFSNHNGAQVTSLSFTMTAIARLSLASCAVLRAVSLGTVP